MTFETLLEELKNGVTLENICKKENMNMVECTNNMVYEDQDLYDFMESIGAEIEDFGVGYAVISTNSSKLYELPYECKPNRFGSDLSDETILYFDYDRIYDVTETI